jgi:FMN phosphatase YigB (HAD superfamily)
MKPFDHLIFDLDDTLLDTSNQLIPQASRESCLAMIESGLNATLEECIDTRAEFVRSTKRYDLYNEIVRKFGVRVGCDAANVARSGYDAFHNREVETHITPMPGVREMLEDLRQHYGLHLVTAGHRETQEAKLVILDFIALFDGIHHVDPTRGERKSEAFALIMASTARPPHRHLSIGNRLDTDIGEARRHGWKACWVRHGEYAHLQPTTPHERPDWTILSIQELMSTCQL